VDPPKDYLKYQRDLAAQTLQRRRLEAEEDARENATVVKPNGTLSRLWAIVNTPGKGESKYQHRPVKHSQRFDDGSVLSTRHDGTTTARVYSPKVDEDFRNLPTGKWYSTELESGETRVTGPTGVKIRGPVNDDGTYVARAWSAPEDNRGNAGGQARSVIWQQAPEGIARGATSFAAPPPEAASK
jgi:hypothetical protein